MNRSRRAAASTIFCMALAICLATRLAAVAQTTEAEPVTWGRAVAGPYAGKIEPRIGGSRESDNDKLRLDIGASVELMSWNYKHDESDNPLVDNSDETRMAVGADFFTWTRLRAAGGFKFPVEAVDYYFGIYGARHNAFSLLRDIRVRVAHISAHLVDGDPSFTDVNQQYITYSREFVDAMVGFETRQLLGMGVSHHGPGGNRIYVGGLFMFHTIPDTLGVITPYIGTDGYVQLSAEGPPLAIHYGYEARLNTELEPIGEHLARLGVKLGRPNSNGVTVEGSYYSGRSMYGQHFSRRESFFSLGFAIDM